MKIIDVLVLACDFSRGFNAPGASRLNLALHDLLSTGRRPIVVLGPEGGDVLESCDAVERCELTSDFDYDGSWFSSVKAGLMAARGPAIAVHWSSLAIEHPSFHELENAAAGRHELDAVALAGRSAWAITLAGAKRLKALPLRTPWPGGAALRLERV